jgi:beta-N-acetylhexosaminidase
MAGARHGQTPEEAALNALLAGADVLLICHHPELQRRIHSYLAGRAERGDLPHTRINEALRRVLALKRRYLTAGRFPRRRTLSAVGRPSHGRLLERILAGVDPKRKDC